MATRIGTKGKRSPSSQVVATEILRVKKSITVKDNAEQIVVSSLPAREKVWGESEPGDSVGRPVVFFIRSKKLVRGNREGSEGGKREERRKRAACARSRFGREVRGGTSAGGSFGVSPIAGRQKGVGPGSKPLRSSRPAKKKEGNQARRLT